MTPPPVPFSGQGRRLNDCEHDNVREYPSGPRDNGEYTEVCRLCGEMR